MATLHADVIGLAGWKALQAASLLGDVEAEKEMQRMSQRLMWVFIVLVITTGVVAAFGVGMLVYRDNERARAYAEAARVEADKQVRLEDLKAAQALRASMAGRVCHLTAEEVERAVVIPVR